jgi:hypothetical protein
MIIFNGSKLDDSVKYDETLNFYWNLEDLKNVFCSNSLGNSLSVKNIRNSAIELYTLTDMWTDKMTIDLDNAKIESNGLTIADDFLKYASTKFNGTDKYNAFIQKSNEYHVYVNFKMRYNWSSNYNTFLQKNDIYNNKYENNSICALILEKMLINVPDRFCQNYSNEIIELPFRKGDFIYMVYTLECLDVSRKYLIKINII